jgi:hypothetical protein
MRQLACAQLVFDQLACDALACDPLAFDPLAFDPLACDPGACLSSQRIGELLTSTTCSPSSTTRTASSNRAGIRDDPMLHARIACEPIARDQLAVMRGFGRVSPDRWRRALRSDGIVAVPLRMCLAPQDRIVVTYTARPRPRESWLARRAMLAARLHGVARRRYTSRARPRIGRAWQTRLIELDDRAFCPDAHLHGWV